MCDDRERLIGYVYGECDEHEHQTIEAHVTHCATCREELSGLRAVRSDLLAWDVPEHGSVWKPFVTPRPTLWRMMPAWGLAAAACAVFAVGAAGGIVTHAFLLKEPVVQAAVAPVTDRTGQAIPASVSREEFDAFVRQMRTEIDQRSGVMASHQGSAIPASLTAAQVRSLLSASEKNQLKLLGVLHNDYQSNKESVQQQLEMIGRRIDGLGFQPVTVK